jgi:hypothetical protein
MTCERGSRGVRGWPSLGGRSWGVRWSCRPCPGAICPSEGGDAAAATTNRAVK